ncbi:MAG TPA: NAD-dependent epimerase/dehydratase family protein [Thermoleophilaceae bacterium]|nr:NAD-dependent epimerase/dehydratase family protein [Thermoleophilaceae bacterium]
MRIVVVGASGNVGTSVLEALAADTAVEEIVGVARRKPALTQAKTTWVEADVVSSDLTNIFRGADCVIHLAWLIQPSRDLETLQAVNVEGSARVFHAVGTAGVPALVYASSVGAYSPGPKDPPVDESWPTEGVMSSYYARHKAATERLLDRFELEQPGVRVVRLRPGLIFKREAAAEIRRFFIGPLLPNPLVRRSLIPIVPRAKRLVFQAVHARDVGEAYRLAAVSDVRGAFNVAADPVLDGEVLAEALGARPVSIHPGALRALADASWRLRLQPAAPTWLDLAFGVPTMDTTRARTELGWTPRRRSDEALLELLEGLRDGAAHDTPPLEAQAGGPLRVKELLTGVGGRQ